ncbi:VanZ family protein [Brevibacterium sp. 5221]|uniref:VanZ family protein n=1 Tax=Brevibacterium rongguiense TaxID=2695267 RepID=A0A6N9H599_9MICO|nr:VanZ family protein [Brevibacterium rongguiense]MYM19210.1 VanZ family protein [Brevibacterium rongguiense]
MSPHVLSAVAAVALGAVAGVVLFVPIVAGLYHRQGGLSLGRLLLWGAALVYFWAIWTYTLLPLPAPDTVRCAGTNTHLGQFAGDLARAWAESGGGLRAFAANPLVLQLALNVLLFVPLGFFVRVLGGRGLLTAGALGLAISALVETTQLTGVWGLYDCAYRVFDVDDMLTNTSGALVGSLLALAVPRRLWGSNDAAPEVPRPVTRPRRLLGMFSDWLASTLILTALTVGLRLGAELLARADRGALALAHWPEAIALATTAGIWLATTLATGATPGDLTVRLAYRRPRMATPPARLLRFLCGSGGYLLILLAGQALPLPGAAAVFALVCIVLVLAPTGPGGLPALATGAALCDQRSPDRGPEAPAGPPQPHS